MTITDAVDLDVTPLSATIGASIRGVDLHGPVSDGVIARLRECLLQYGVIFLPGQHLGPAEHLAFARRFGEPTPAHPVIPGIPGFPEIFEIDYTKTAKVRETYGEVVDRYDGLSWHTDVTFIERPPLGSILNAIVIPPAGGDTMFSDQRAAYESLSAPMRAFLDGLTAVHDGRAAFGGLLKRRKDAERRAAQGASAGIPPASERDHGRGGEWEGKQFTALEPSEHPVVRTHPETGRKSLFVNPGFTSYIKGLTRSESNALLQYLYAHSVEPRFTVRYHWTAGDLGFWDNRVTQHSVVGDFTGHRVIQRVTLYGDKPA